MQARPSLTSHHNHCCSPRLTSCHINVTQNAQVPEEDFELPEDMELGDADGGGPEDSGADDGQPDEEPGAADEGGDFKDADARDADKEPAPAEGQDEAPLAQRAHSKKCIA